MKQLYGIRDVKAKAFLGGIHVFNLDQPATRMFLDLLGSKETIIGAHPEDFELWCLGMYDDELDFLEVTAEKMSEYPVTGIKPVLVLSGQQWLAAQAKGPELTKEA